MFSTNTDSEDSEQLKLNRSDIADCVTIKPTFPNVFEGTGYSVSQEGVVPIEDVESAIKSNSWWLPEDYNEDVVKSINRSIVIILCNTDHRYKRMLHLLEFLRFMDHIIAMLQAF